MKMENLNKTQIVLLTLLTSFVTSIATGIVTVTLMDQAPPGVTQTINRVVERTIEKVTPGENQVTTVVKEVIVKEEDLIANAVEKASKSLVHVSAVDGEGVDVPLGLGVVVSGDGYIATDKIRLAGNRNNLIISYNEKIFNADIVSGEDSDIVILKIRPSENTSDSPDKTNNAKIENKTDVNSAKEGDIFKPIPASLADSDNIKLGQVAVSFSGEMGNSVQTGIVSRLKKIALNEENSDKKTPKEEKLEYIITNMKISTQSAGGPLFDTNGNVIGVNVILQDGSIVSIPINKVKETLFKATDIVKKDTETNTSEPSGLTKSE